MPRNPIPTYRKHKSGRAVVDIYCPDGRRTQRLLPGCYGSDESQAAYQKLIAQLQAHGGKLPQAPGQTGPNDLTIDELVLRFLTEKVVVDYVDAGGRPTTEQLCFRSALKPLSRLFGWASARDFDAKSLGAVRDSMISGAWMNEAECSVLAKQNKVAGWSRGNINKCISRIRSMFRWAVLQKIVPASTVTDLTCLPALKRGRGGARESVPVISVDPEIVDATLSHLGPVVADMVRVQLLIACRPGELCNMQGGDIDRAGPVWLFNPRSHKNLHRGHKRTVAIGPQAQLILRRWLKDDPDAFVFSPAEQDAINKTTKRAARKSKVQPSQFNRSKPNAKRKPKAKFTTTSFNRAIHRASEKAGVGSWHANQLRHTAALLVEREFGAVAARAVLGHRCVNMTAHYSGIDVKRASDVAAKVG